MYIGKYYPQRPLYIQRTFLLCRYTLTYFHVACNLSRLDFFKFVLIRSINIARIRRYTVMYHLAQTVFHVYFLQLPLALSQLCCCHVIIIKEIINTVWFEFLIILNKHASSSSKKKRYFCIIYNCVIVSHCRSLMIINI